MVKEDVARAQNALLSYLSVAESIKQNDFLNSPIYNLEKLIVDPLNTLRTVLSDSSMTRTLSNDHLRQFFIALVAPSFCGKTQTAFVFESVKPLYFPIELLWNNAQDIYKNYISLSLCLKVCAKNDLTMLKNMSTEEERLLFDLPERSEALYTFISASNLILKYKNVPFATVGLLMNLIKLSDQEFESSGKAWMQYHADRRDFKFYSKSFEQFMEFYRDRRDFCVFIDEFLGEDWLVLIRNICRAMGIRIIVSNTNTNIANLVGLKQSRSSRAQGDYFYAWSIIFNLLNYSKFDINSLSPLQNVAQHPHFQVFFDYLRTAKIRPGVLQYLITNIRSESSLMTGTFVGFFDTLINNIGNAIKERKFTIFTTEEGRSANLGLLLNYSYNSDFPSRFNHKSYLENHLYFLDNPVNKSKYLFITYPAIGRRSFLSIPKVVAKQSIHGLVSWDLELVYFDKEEIITILSCFAIKPEISVMQILLEAQSAAIRRDRNPATTANPNALKLDGNILEVLATTCIIDSSHHRYVSDRVTFAGQNGIEFLKSLISNLISDTSLSTDRAAITEGTATSRGTVETLNEIVQPVERMELSLTFPSDPLFDLESDLNRFSVPFLYASNMGIPQFLQELTSVGAINVGSCTRTADNENIDILFDISKDSVPCKAVAECKNWARPVYYRELEEIIQKARSTTNTKLSFIFCNIIHENPFASVAESLYEYCVRERVNVYRVKKLLSGHQYEMEPIEVVSDAPNMICIILEICEIDEQNLNEMGENLTGAASIKRIETVKQTPSQSQTRMQTRSQTSSSAAQAQPSLPLINAKVPKLSKTSENPVKAQSKPRKAPIKVLATSSNPINLLAKLKNEKN